MESTVRMRKANGERLVPAEKVTEYLEMGYSVLDSRGNVVQKPKACTVPELKAQVAELEKENAALKARLCEFEAAQEAPKTDGDEVVTHEEETAQDASQPVKKGKTAKKVE